MSSLYFACIALICGASDCIRTIDLICRNVNGTSTARTQIVRSTIEKPQLTPTLLWKNFRTDSKTSISGWKMLAVTSIGQGLGLGAGPVLNNRCSSTGS